MAKAPWGPWSAPVVIVDPFREGYGRFIHQAVFYYTLSSWNPYAVHLMKTTLARMKVGSDGQG